MFLIYITLTCNLVQLSYIFYVSIVIKSIIIPEYTFILDNKLTYLIIQYNFKSLITGNS